MFKQIERNAKNCVAVRCGLIFGCFSVSCFRVCDVEEILINGKLISRIKSNGILCWSKIRYFGYCRRCVFC
jgi:hypothetical protein